MLTKGKITIYNKQLDTATKLNAYTKTIYDAWYFLKNKAEVNEGLSNSHSIIVRIPYNENIGSFAIGDIIFVGEGIDIESQNDLDECYVITSIVNNLYGPLKHIHIEGR